MLSTTFVVLYTTVLLALTMYVVETNNAGVDVDDDGLDDQEDDDADRDDQRLRQTVRQEDRDGGESVRTSSDRFCPGSMRSVGNGGGGTSSYESMPDAATATVTATAFPGNNTVAPRRRRRDEVQLKRNERRASPYSTSLVSRPTARQEAKAKANAKSTRAKANAKSTRAKANAKSTRASTDGGTYGGRNGKKAGPTAGETQVLMSLWAL